MCECRWLQQLCRDWSKSGKRVDAASAMKNNSSDSNSNDRSSSTSRSVGFGCSQITDNIKLAQHSIITPSMFYSGHLLKL